MSALPERKKETDETLDEFVEKVLDHTEDNSFQLDGYKLNDKQVKFAVEIAKGTAHAEAYRKAGYSTNYNWYKLKAKARDLTKNYKVQHFVSRIREKFLDQQVINIDYIIRQMIEVKDKAENNDDYKTELDCLKEMAKVAGIYNHAEKQDNRTQVQNVIRFEPGTGNEQ